MNPDISVNALMLYTNSNRGNQTTSPEQNGPSIQEAEIQAFSDVDPYTRLNALLSIHQEQAKPPAAPARNGGEWKIEPEELFVDTTTLPYVTIRAGKFKGAFGRHNTLHTHAFPFIDAPLANTVFFGDEGLNDVGLSAAGLVPLPWFSEVTLQAFSGRTEGDDYFNSRSPNDIVFLAHFKNVWDLNDDLTAEFGLSDAYGKNESNDSQGSLTAGSTNFYGADLTFKWRPMNGGKYHAFVWSTEYTNRDIERAASNNRGQAYASWLQYQFAERWWAQVRSEYLEVNDTAAVIDAQPFQRKYSALVGFFPSEFSGFRIQYSYLEDGKDLPEQKLYAQLNFTIGAHPAHSY